MAAMQTISIRTAVALHSVSATVREWARDQRGQTATEYMGIIFVLGVMILAIATSGLGKTIADHAKTLIDGVAGGGHPAPKGQ